MTKLWQMGTGSTQRELSNEYQLYRVYMVLKKSLRPCALDEGSLSIGRVSVCSYLKGYWSIIIYQMPPTGRAVRTQVFPLPFIDH